LILMKKEKKKEKMFFFFLFYWKGGKLGGGPIHRPRLLFWGKIYFVFFFEFSLCLYKEQPVWQIGQKS
jgi:hypothetical protein